MSLSQHANAHTDTHARARRHTHTRTSHSRAHTQPRCHAFPSLNLHLSSRRQPPLFQTHRQRPARTHTHLASAHKSKLRLQKMNRSGEAKWAVAHHACHTWAAPRYAVSRRAATPPRRRAAAPPRRRWSGVWCALCSLTVKSLTVQSKTYGFKLLKPPARKRRLDKCIKKYA